MLVVTLRLKKDKVFMPREDPDPIDPNSGTRDGVLRFIGRKTGLKVDALRKVYAMIRLPTIEAAADAMDCSVRNITPEADLTAAALMEHTGKFISFRNGTDARGGVSIMVNDVPTRGSVDTVPISVPNVKHMFQPKYQDAVVKFLVSVSHNGQVMSVDGPYSGASHDGVIGDHCHFFARASAAFPEESILADGIFSVKDNPNCIIPPTREKVKACKVQARRAKNISHYRSRVEHVFGGGAGILRFKKLTADRWSRKLGLLKQYFVAACIYRNAEIFVRCGPQGLYKNHEMPEPVAFPEDDVPDEEVPQPPKPPKAPKAFIEEDTADHPMLPIHLPLTKTQFFSDPSTFVGTQVLHECGIVYASG